MTAALMAGSATVDITPPLEAGFLLSAVRSQWQPFRAVRQPLLATALVIESRARRWAWVSADVLGFSSAAFGSWSEFKQKICLAAGSPVAAQELLLAATHTHSAPESLGLTDLPGTAAFQSWRSVLIERLAGALRQAAQRLSPRRLGLARTELEGFTINRRIRGAHGIELSGVADAELVRRQADKPRDDSVWVAAFLDEAGLPRELIVNATCHPVYEMCRPEISPDFPGAMRAALQGLDVPATTLFFNGAAGNINPLAVSGGPEPATKHGQALAQRVAQALDRLTLVAAQPFELVQRRLRLPCRAAAGWPDARQWIEAELVVARIGPAVFVFVPGEPFVETALAYRSKSPFAWTAIIGYTGDSIGYIPTETAFEEGGYEIGPGRWSFLTRGCEPMIRDALAGMLVEIAS